MADGNVKQSDVVKQKERRIVSWTPGEDDILREQIQKNGTENWAYIASKFDNKSIRQCKRRWYTYLSPDFKKGSWTLEEDILLCEAQREYGNKWTEIAKVVSGRTDNAVKNRFTTLCKNKAKRDLLEKENNAGSSKPNNKRAIVPDELNLYGSSVSAVPPMKKTRAVISSTSETHRARPPFAALDQNLETGANNLLALQQDRNKTDDGNKIQGTFLTKNDPRLHALMQQEELLTSLAIKVNSEDTDQSLDNAWQVLQDYLNQNKDSDPSKMINGHPRSEILKLMEFVEDLRSSNEAYQPLLRKSELHMNSPSNSDYSTGSTMLIQPETGQADRCVVDKQDTEVWKRMELCYPPNSDKGIFLSSESIQADGTIKGALTDMDLSPPMQLTPFFKAIAAEAPTPNFSESEKNFLIKTLGLESPTPDQKENRTKSPTCKRALLDSL